MSERERIYTVLPWLDREAVDGLIADLGRAGLQITPGPGYDHSGNDNHLVAGDHGPVITPQAEDVPIGWYRDPNTVVLNSNNPMAGTDLNNMALYTAAQAGEAEDGRYSLGLCADGCAILYDGVPVTVDDVIRRLNRTAPACADPECWQRPSPVAPTAGEDLISRDAAMTVLARWVSYEHWMKASDDMLAVAVQPSPVSPVWQAIETAPSKELVFAISEGDEIEMVLGETVSSAHYDDGEPLYLGWLPREALPPPPDSPGTTGGS